MRLSIIIEDSTSKYEDKHVLGAEIHNILKGDQDYIKSNVVLNCTDGSSLEEVLVYVAKSDLIDKNRVSKKVADIVDEVLAE